MKKEKLLIQHPTDPLSTQSELPVPQPLFDDRSMNLSEKEIIDLFEKMMVSSSKIFWNVSPEYWLTLLNRLLEMKFMNLYIVLETKNVGEELDKAESYLLYKISCQSWYWPFLV